MDSVEIDELKQFTGAQLKSWLRALGRKSTGNKAELVLRLLAIPSELRGEFVPTQTTPRDANLNANGHQTDNEEESDDDDDEREVYEDSSNVDEVCQKSANEKNAADEKKMSDRDDEWTMETLKRELMLVKRELAVQKRETELLKRENEMMTKKKSVPTHDDDGKSMMNFSVVKDLIPEFAGADDNYEQWELQLRSVLAVFKLDENSSRALISTRLKGRALRWFHSKADIMSVPIDELLTEMGTIFKDRASRLMLKQKFEGRKWSSSETFQEYFHEKVILANKVSIHEDELMEYLIEGIPDQTIRSQAKMHCFRDKEHLLEAFRTVTLTRKAPALNTEPSTSKQFRCYNCNALGHMANSCKKPKRPMGACHVCAEMGHYAAVCPKRKEVHHVGDEGDSDENVRKLLYTFIESNFICKFSLGSLIDTGSPISFVREQFVPHILIKKQNVKHNFFGINKSPLNVIGVVQSCILFEEEEIKVELFVVKNETTKFPVILGRDFIKKANLRLMKIKESKMNETYDEKCNNLMNIEIDESEETYIYNESLDVNKNERFRKIFNDCYLKCDRPDEPLIKCEIKLNLINEKPFHCPPRRLSYYEKERVREMLDDMLQKKIIRPSNSEYSSPIVLVRKKNDNIRMCIDYRSLNKITLKDNYPIPLIDDMLDRLANKTIFSLLDLKSAFYHVHVNEESVKYTSFVTPLGQYEYLRMPFGLRNAPPTFQRFVNMVFDDMIRAGKVAIYLDDILIATSDFEEHLSILKEVFEKLVSNKLELRLDKCRFIEPEIRYLGYKVSKEGIRPDEKNIESVANFPIPQNAKAVHSFLGLCSYFRRFVEGFSTKAKPLYELIKKKVSFKFGEEELRCFEELKAKLLAAPILAIYDPRDETELHCDASALGFGAILLQKKSDGKFHPIFYFSKRTTDQEAKFHSFELETLAIIYALQRFRIYLHGMRFKIVTDCNSLTLTLNKKEVNPRIARWALELQNYDYVLEHRNSERMQHVDALSRNMSILVLEENTFEQNLSICQHRDRDINKIREMLEKEESSYYEMRNGLVYRKSGGNLLFYVPAEMQKNVLYMYHDDMGHVGCDKVYENLTRMYWFPKIRNRIREHISNCLKCITFSPKFGKHEGLLHCIPKGDIPFDTVHIDHFGPVTLRKSKKKYVFLVVDGFTKFNRLYAVRGTGTNEAISSLKSYFNSYSRPKLIVSDRGSAFTSNEFKSFLEKNGVKHVLVATGSPQANGQVERVNRSLAPMLAKMTSAGNEMSLDKVLPEIEHVMNNTVHRSTGMTPSELLFGIRQRGMMEDPLRERLEEILNKEKGRDLEDIRMRAAARIKKCQEYNKKIKDKSRTLKSYQVGDYVVVKNFISQPGACRKIAPRFKGPYQVIKILPNDRYLLKDVTGFQLTQIPYEGVWEVANIKPWKTNNKREIGTITCQDGRTVVGPK